VSSARSLRISFVHPDLLVGGAERLVVDAAVALQDAGHRVAIYTTHHDRERCFEETRDGTLDVRVTSSPLPRHIAGRMLAPLAIARTSLAAMRARSEPCDLFFVDSVAHCIPLLKQACVPVLFYCHYPDRLLAPPGGRMRSAYRRPIDALEARGIALADRVVVNSRFTANAFTRVFPRAVPPQVLPPGVDVERHARAVAAVSPGTDCWTAASINRFERKKNLPLAVESFARFRARLGNDQRVRLVLAGSHDPRLADSHAAMDELRRAVEHHGLGASVHIRANLSDGEKLQLLAEADCVLYTPTDEHFGYVPIEAMAAGRPVIVADSGGPRETVGDGVTGFVRPPTADAFADALGALYADPQRARAMGEAGRRHVQAHFSSERFAACLREIVESVA